MPVTLLVNGVDKTAYLKVGSASFTQPVKGQRGTSHFILQNLPTDSAYMPVEGQSVQWLDGVAVVFRGTIDTFDRSPIIASGGGFNYSITAVSPEQRLDKRFVTRAFPSGTTCGAIVSSIMATEAAAEGIAAGSISAGATLAIAKLYDHARISDAFTELASLCDNFTWYIDPADGKLYFAARTTTAAPFSVADAEVLALTGPGVSVSRSEYRNRQHVKISETNLIPNKETFQGDDSTSVFTLSKPIRDVVSIVLTTATGTTCVGTFNSNPSDMDSIGISDFTYVFVAVMPPPQIVTMFTQLQNYVLIGATKEDTAQNLTDAVNDSGNGKGTTYASTTWANPYLSGMTVSGASVTAAASPASPWPQPAFSSATAAFTWGTPTDTVPGASAIQTFAERGNAGSGSYQWIYDVGGTTIEQAPGQTPPATGESLTVEYKPIGFGVVTVDDVAEQVVRAAAEGGSGIYENLAIREDLLTTDAGIAAATALLKGNETMTERVTFDTDTSGLLPGQYVSIVDAALNVNASYLIQSVTGSIVPAASGDYWRYRVLAVSGTQTTIEGWAALANKGTPGGIFGSTGSSSKLSPQQQLNTATSTEFWEANFGLDDDTVGTNYTKKKVPLKGDGIAYTGYVTIDRLAAQLQPETVIDILYSSDEGANWTSIFPAGNQNKIVIPPTVNGTDQDIDFAANPRIREITTFADVNLKKGWMLRPDVIQGGGATDIEIYLRGKPSGTRGQQLNYNGPGVALLALTP